MLKTYVWLLANIKEEFIATSRFKMCFFLPPAPTLWLAVPGLPFWPFSCLWLSGLRLCSWVSWKKYWRGGGEKNRNLAHILSMMLTKPPDMTWVHSTAQSPAMLMPRRHTRISVSCSVTGGSADSQMSQIALWQASSKSKGDKWTTWNVTKLWCYLKLHRLSIYINIGRFSIDLLSLCCGLNIKSKGSISLGVSLW